MTGWPIPTLKLNWAKNHLTVLSVEISKFCSPSNAYTILREDDLENGRHVLRIQLKDVPDHICLIAGDAFYNLRSSLDQLVWSLARLTGIPKRTQFPVVDSLTRSSLNRFNKDLTGIPSEAVCEIDALQPYHRGTAFKSHPLWRLDEICNLDKHRRIPANGSMAEFFFSGFTREDQANGTVRIDVSEDGFRVSVPLALKHKLDFDPRIPVTVNFGGDSSGISENPSGILEIYNFVAEEVFPRFRRFFPDRL